MQTSVADHLADDARVQEAEAILRKCVHCGFCLATCPTYNLVGDELDSPRGRIYLIKQVVEGQLPTSRTQRHLDRCLTCRNCETTCPSGVEYGHLVDIGRALVDERVQRPPAQRWLRWLVRKTIAHRSRIGPLVAIGRRVRPMLPRSLASSVPLERPAGAWPVARHPRRMLVLDGCVQPSMAPATNAATARVLDALGISLVRTPAAGCCGAVPFHLDDQPDAIEMMKRNVDAWWPAIDDGAEAIVVTASGCGVMVKDYARLLENDPDYAWKAARISLLARDIVEVLQEEPLDALRDRAARIGPVAFHPPCTLQHGQRLMGATERLLVTLGFTLTPIADVHTCCGSAGTYSLFQRSMSRQLREQKIDSLLVGEPAVVATANIGCQLHLQSGLLARGSKQSVVHWVELIDRLLESSVVSASPGTN